MFASDNRTWLGYKSKSKPPTNMQDLIGSNRREPEGATTPFRSHPVLSPNPNHISKEVKNVIIGFAQQFIFRGLGSLLRTTLLLNKYEKNFDSILIHKIHTYIWGQEWYGREQTTRNPTQSNNSANTLLIFSLVNDSEIGALSLVDQIDGGSCI